MSTTDPFELQRFVDAQESIYAEVVAELRAGQKRTHWMWFVFPQHRALGHSAMAKRYGISSMTEAKAYVAHAVLGARLAQCCELVLAVKGRTANEIFGSPDDLKLRSSMTLFAAAVPEVTLFARVLEKYYGGQPDACTLELLS